MTYNGDFVVPGQAGTAEQFNYLLSRMNRDMQGRLTLQSGTPVPHNDIGLSANLYYTPLDYGNFVSLFDTAKNLWRPFELTEEVSFSLVSCTDTTKPYDIYLYNNSGTLTIEKELWTSPGTPAKRTKEGSIFVHQDDKRLRLLGSIMMYSSGQSIWDWRRRFVSNLYNRKCFSLRSGGQAGYYLTSTSFVLMNASETAKCYGVWCIPVSLRITASGMAHHTTLNQYVTGIGIDSVTVSSAFIVHQAFTDGVAAQYDRSVAFYDGPLAQGYHYFAGLDYYAGTTRVATLSSVLHVDSGFEG